MNVHIQSARSLVRWVLQHPVLVLWSLFLIGQPFYVVQSGLPQPGDVLLIPLFLMTVAGWNGRLKLASSQPLRALLIFTFWVTLVNVAWMIATGDVGLTSKGAFSPLQPMFYMFNAAVVLVVAVLYERYGARFIALTFHLIIWIAIFQVGLSFLHFGSRTVRGTVFFNNPNQLGYYAMISACTIAVCHRQLRGGTLYATIGFVACIYLALLSASKAAVGGSVVLFVLTVVTNPRVIIALTLGTGVMVGLGGPVARAIEITQRRVGEDRNPNATFFEERGYDRIQDHPQYLLFGAGEGATTRFSDGTLIGTHEIHSSAGTILFAYGIPGVLLFLMFLLRVIRGASIRASFILLPPLAYTVAHQGLRFTSLWVLFGLFITIKQLVPAAKPGGPPKESPA